MPRIEFDTISEAKEWITDKILYSKKDYDGYLTQKKELILMPNKSTQPILYGYVRVTTKEALRKLFPSNFKIYSCDHFEWDSQHTISRRE